MNQDPTLPTSLLVHDGELTDVRALFDEMGVPCVERQGLVTDEDRSSNWELVIGTPKRVLDLRLDPTCRVSSKIAVMSQDSRTLRNSLRRDGVELLVRRPVHPATLRALIVHALYAGPEKRRSTRVKVGGPVTYRTGWRQRPAILMDLSLGGCRVRLDRRLDRGETFTLHLPADVAGGKSVSLKSHVLNSTADPSEAEAQFETSARFESISKRQIEKLRAAIKTHSEGPATFEHAPLAADSESNAASDATDARKADASPSGTVVSPSAASNATTARRPRPAAPAPSAPPCPKLVTEAAADRRETDRHALDRRVISLTEEAARVLMGRDITIGGMRVNRNPTLVVGTDVQLAIHNTTRDTPLVVRAKVHRDDGDRGMVLRFHALSPDASQYLNDVMDHLPLADVDEDGQGCLVTEILEAG